MADRRCDACDAPRASCDARRKRNAVPDLVQHVSRTSRNCGVRPRCERPAAKELRIDWHCTNEASPILRAREQVAPPRRHEVTTSQEAAPVATLGLAKDRGRRPQGRARRARACDFKSARKGLVGCRNLPRKASATTLQREPCEPTAFKAKANQGLAPLKRTISVKGYLCVVSSLALLARTMLNMSHERWQTE